MLRCAATLITAVLLIAQAPIPKALPQSPHTTNQEAVANNERGTEKEPVFVKVLPAEKSKAEIASEEAKEKAAGAVETRLADLTGDLANYTKSLFIATAILAGLTGLLVLLGFSQSWDTKRMIRATEISANAARASADAALTQLRPSLLISGRGLQRAGLEEPFVVWSEAENLGQSTAYKVQILTGVQFLPFPLPGPLPPSQNNTARDAANFDIPRGKKHATRRAMRRVPTEQEMVDWSIGKSALYMHGTIFYKTDFGDDVEADFCQFISWQEYSMWKLRPMAVTGGPGEANFQVAGFGNDTRIHRRGEKT